jgi:transposase, IS5 family
VECIGRGKAPKPYEFGVKVSGATPLNRCRGGPFGAHGKAWPGNPYDGPTLAPVIPAIEATIGAELSRMITDAGYKGHHAPEEKRVRVYGAGPKRGLSPAIQRALRRRAAGEPVIGPLKGEPRRGRNHLAGSQGDAINAGLAATGSNFRLLLRWLALLWAGITTLLDPAPSRSTNPQPA